MCCHKTFPTNMYRIQKKRSRYRDVIGQFAKVWKGLVHRAVNDKLSTRTVFRI